METDEKNTVEQKEVSQGALDNASKEKAQEVKPIPVTETPEFKAAVEQMATKVAQSMKDKELKPLYERLSKAEKDAQTKEQALKEQQEDAEIERRLGAQVQNGEITEAERTTVISFRDDLRKKAKAHNAEVEKFTREKATYDEESKTFATAKSVNAVFRLADAQGKSLKYSEAEKIASDAEGNQRVMELLIKSFASETKTEEPKRPDSSLPSAPGGATSDAEFIKKFGSGELPHTLANEERYTKIQNS